MDYGGKEEIGGMRAKGQGKNYEGIKILMWAGGGDKIQKIILYTCLY